MSYIENDINYDELNICIPTVSVILERIFDGERQILIQTRFKPLIDPEYSGYLEIPSGIIEKYESIIESAIRETKEETGVEISEENFNIDSQRFNLQEKDIVADYKPFCVTQQLKGGRSYLNVGLVCKLDQKTDVNLFENIKETRNPRWINMDELNELLHNKQNKIFPLNIPLLTRFLEIVTNK